MPLVSIVMAIKNAEPFLDACMESILVQTITDFELICVVDSSTDRTLDILRSYACRDDRVILQYGSKAGPGGARNHGAQFAKGEYWAFLDADDVILPKYLEELVLKAESIHADIAICRSMVLDVKNRMHQNTETVHFSPSSDKSFFSVAECPNIFTSFSGWAWDKLFRASFCKSAELQFGNNYLLEDGAFVYPALVKANRIIIADDALICHRKHKDSLEATKDHFSQRWPDAIANARSIFEKTITFDNNTSLFPDFCRWLLNYMIWALRHIDYSAERKRYFDTLSALFVQCHITEKDLQKYGYAEDYIAYLMLKNSVLDSRARQNLAWACRKIVKGMRYCHEKRYLEALTYIANCGQKRG